MPTTIYIDDHAKKLLNMVKKLLKNKGIFGQSYSDVIRYLYKLAEKDIKEQEK